MTNLLRFCGPLTLRAVTAKASQVLRVNNPFKRYQSYDVNTNVAKDVIMFKYENPRFFKLMNIFGISQFCFWNYLSHFSYTTLRDAPVDSAVAEDPNIAWYEKLNLGDNKFRNSITAFCFLIGGFLESRHFKASLTNSCRLWNPDYFMDVHFTVREVPGANERREANQLCYLHTLREEQDPECSDQLHFSAGGQSGS